jgi:hypothetical protein
LKYKSLSTTGFWFRIALLNFFVAGIVGLALRLAFVVELSWPDFMNAMHAHSHVAMLGWLYMAIYALFVELFLPESIKNSKRYTRLFWVSEIAIVGILVTMLTNGYHVSSMVFLGTHVILSYVFMWFFLQDTRHVKGAEVSMRFARTALWFMALSTLALWAMGPLMSLSMTGSAFYYASVQFFLHFQFNGWFIFAALAIFFRVLGQLGMGLEKKALGAFFYLLVASCLLTYVLAVTWSNPIPLLFWINSLGVILQVAALYVFARMILGAYSIAQKMLSPAGRRLFGIAMICFALKIFMQAVVVVPYIATVSYTVRNYVIGFIHLILIGMLTHMVLGAAVNTGIINPDSNRAKIGFMILLVGFLLTELILFLQGTMFWAALGFIPFYYELLFGISILLPLSILLILISRQRPDAQIR